jgi:hypothetical protein
MLHARKLKHFEEKRNHVLTEETKEESQDLDSYVCLPHRYPASEDHFL